MRVICGVYLLNGAPVLNQTLQRMCRAMQSPLRPSRIEVWVAGSIGLGVVDFDAVSDAPLIVQSASGAVLAADIRLDDGDELQRSVGLPGSTSDAEIAATVLDREDAAGATALAGELALAQWLPGERRLLLVRDALGVRPLVYYHRPGECVIFASFPEGIFGSGLVDRALDEVALARVALHLHRHESSLFEGVHDLRPGHTLAVAPDRFERKTYWLPRQPERRHRRPEEAAEELRGLLQRAVDCRLGGTGAVAAHLSGGLDSSAIAVMAARRLSTDCRTLFGYSFLAEIWPGLQIDDETPFVEAVLRQEPSIRWKRIETALTADWLHDRYHPDLPLSMQNDSPEHSVYGDASARGASVLLSGWGGDEGITFNGRGALAAAFTSFRWGYLAQEMMALRRQRGFPLHNTFIGDVLEPLLSSASMNRLRSLAGRQPLATENAGAACVQPWLLENLDLDGTVLGPHPTKNQLTLLASPHLSERTAGYATMAARHGIAVSFPFLDRRVVEFALSLPPDWHIRQGWKRAIFRDAMKGVLPYAIERRHTKLAPIARVSYEYAKESGRIRERVAELAGHPVVSRIFDVEAMAAVAASIPSLETAGVRATLTMVPAFAQVLTCAMWVEQQF